MSGLTELPSTAATSLGPAKEDRIVYMNETFRAQAFLINKIRTYLIQMGEMLGLGDDSTPGSLGYRLAAVEAALSVPAPVKITGAAQQSVTVIGSETVIGSFGAFAPALYASPAVSLEATAVFAPATSGTAEVRLYDVGTRTTPTAGTLRGTIIVTAFDAGVRKCVSLPLTVTPTPGVNTATISDSERVYELRAILLGAAPGDILTVENVSLSVTGTVTGGTFAPNNAPYLALAASGALSDERVMTPADSLQGTDGGPGGTYELRLVNDVPAPGVNMQYATDGTGTRGWYPKPGAVTSWQLDVTTASQFVGGGTAPTTVNPLIPASRARVNGTSSVGTMLAADAFSITTDLGGPFILTFAGGESTPQAICNRINAQWQAASGFTSGPNAWIAFVQGSDRGRVFIESPTRNPLGSGVVSIVDNVAGTLVRMGFAGPGPLFALGTAQSQPVYFGTFPRRDCTVDFTTFNALLNPTDQFTYQNETVGATVVTLAGAPYANLAALVADINAQVPGMDPAHVDPRDPLERFFLSSDLCGAVASQTLTDGLGTPLNTMGFTVGPLLGVNDTPTLTPGNFPAAWADPGASPSVLVLDMDGCSGGVAVFRVNATMPVAGKKRIMLQAVPGARDPFGGTPEAVTLGTMGMIFNYDAARNVGQIFAATVDGTAFISMSGTNAATTPQIPQPCYVFKLEADLITYLTSIAAGSPYEGCPSTLMDARIVGTLTVASPPPVVTPDPQLRGMTSLGGPQIPFNGAFADWYVDPANPPNCEQFGICLFFFGPSYGPVRWYISAASVEALP